jgi:type IV secretion system protein TrbL
MWRKLWMWQLAFVLYKPVAATVYAAAFVTIGNGKSATDQVSGLALMIMSMLALPALLRLMMPISARISSGGGASNGGGSPPQGPSGASGVNTSAPGAATAGAGASGAGTAAGPPGMAVGAAVQTVGALKGMAESAAAAGTQEK